MFALNNIDTPYNLLEPNLILNAIESVGFQPTGGLYPLNSYENRVYQIEIEGSAPLIAKFYRPHRWSSKAILEEHQFALELGQHEIPVIAPLVSETGQTLHEYEGFRFALFPRKGGRAFELDNVEHLEWIGRFIGRLHAVGACKLFQHRIQLNTQNYGYDAYHFLIENNFIPLELLQSFSKIVEAVLQKIEERFQQIDSLKLLRLHGDCHGGNILWNNSGPHIVDLDDCLTGPAVQDIWMLLSGNNEHDLKRQLNYILRGYDEFHEFDYREVKLIEALRTLRMIHYSAWLAKRWKDPTFPLNFPWFNTQHYWQEQLKNLNDQLLLLSND